MTTLEALQQTLAAEHAAVHVLGFLGGTTSASRTPELRALVRARYDVHRGRREQLVVMVRNLGGDPVPAEPGYALPDAATPRATRAAGAEVERRCAETYASTVGSTTRQEREWAVMALTESATALLSWGQSPEAFPGAPDLGR